MLNGLTTKSDAFIRLHVGRSRSHKQRRLVYVLHSIGGAMYGSRRMLALDSA